MSKVRPDPTGVERRLGQEEIIVSKTDLTGHITYANDVFLEISGFEEEEILGASHSILRHPDMPRCVFKLLWDEIQQGRELFAYVQNLCKNGDHYWVLAHVTPTFDEAGRITGFHSNRRCPEPAAVDAARKLYAELWAEESKHARDKAVEAGTARLQSVLMDAGRTYGEFVFSL